MKTQEEKQTVLSKRFADVFTPAQIETIREIVKDELAAIMSNSVHGAVDTVLDANKGAVIVIDRLAEGMNIEIADPGNLESLLRAEERLGRQFLEVTQSQYLR